MCHLAPPVSTSSLPPAAVTFEEATASQAAEASQAGLESTGKDDAVGHDTVFGHEDARGFLQRLRVAQDLYSGECKWSHCL